MAFTITELITLAYYESGIIGREFQTVNAYQINDGLIYLNELLARKTIENGNVPYYSQYTFNAIVGTEKYFIPNLIEVETLTFFINSVRYCMQENKRKYYFGSARANNVVSLPFNWHCEPAPGGANLFLYFFPDQQYPMELYGKFRLASVSLNDDLFNPFAFVNLGLPIVTGTGTFGAGQFVVNGVDLAGTYATPTAFVAFINTGIIPFVRATYINNLVTLTNVSGTPITISTLGTQGNTNNVTFSNFSTINGPQSQSFLPQKLDDFYINFLKCQLAVFLCSKYNFVVPPGLRADLDEYIQMLSNRVGPMDLRMTKMSTLSGNATLNYAQANLGHGWTTN